MHILFLILRYITYGFVLAVVTLLVIGFAQLGFVSLTRFFHASKWRDTHPYTDPLRIGDWQYDQPFFDKIEEFRSDFT